MHRINRGQFGFVWNGRTFVTVMDHGQAIDSFNIGSQVMYTGTREQFEAGVEQWMKAFRAGELVVG